MPSQAQNQKVRDLFNMIRAYYSVIHVPTPEEDRLLRVLRTWMGKSGHASALVTWSETDGWEEDPIRGHRQTPDSPECMDPVEALDRILGAGLDTSRIYVFRDIHPYFEHRDNSSQLIRKIRDVSLRLRNSPSALLLVSPSLQIPSDLEKNIAVAEFPLPDSREVEGILTASIRDAQQNPELAAKVGFSPEETEALARASSGLTQLEIEDAFAKALIETTGNPDEIIRSIHRTKQDALRKSRCLEAFPDLVGMESVGGLDELKSWVTTRKRIFTDEARAYGLSYPKGLLTMGVPGGGKGLSARAVAHSWGIPLLRFDFSAVFDGLVGGSEGNLREALRIAEAMAPCVLWVDEIEKGLSGVGSSDRSDGGTTARVFGSLLTWLQEKTAPVFCYFTANDITALPPELLRKGRVDEIFFIDVPTARERDEIFRIHLKKKKRDPDNFDVEALVVATEGLVGAEIEELINDAMVRAFSADEEVGSDHILRARDRMVPLIKSQEQKIATLRDFVESGRAMRASSPDPAKQTLPTAPTHDPLF